MERTMYKEHPVFEKPENENVKIWRYMDFTKFVSLLDKTALFFCRTDKLGDPFEGSYPRENASQREKAYKAWLKSMPEPIQEIFKQTPSSITNFFKQLTKHTFINSWHENEYESAAMWKVYVKNNEGIAIQSTFSRLRDCFTNGTPDINIGEVRYIDYERETISNNNFFYPFLRKRKSFEHEQELRAVIFHPKFVQTLEGPLDFSKPAFECGMNVSVDLNILISLIYVAPTTPKWLVNLVESITNQYGLDKKVLQSDLDKEPFF